MAKILKGENIGKFIQVSKDGNTEMLRLVGIDEDKDTCVMVQNRGRGRIHYQFHIKEDEIKYSFKLMS